MIFCSSPAYWAALEALGADIVGLSGNHVNDFGQEGAARVDCLVSEERNTHLWERFE